MTATTLGPTGPSMTPLAPGDPRSFGEYRTVGRLGAGGMGEAFLAERAGAWVVIKAVREGASPEVAARLIREVEALARIDSPRVARVVASHPHGPRPWFAVEFVPGLTLAQRLAVHGPLAPGEVGGFAAGLLECLRAVHAAGVVHRDLKPENVVLTATGPRVIDFGTAEVDQATRLTAMGNLVGTVGWMAPEQVAGGEPTPAVDVHAWGLLVLFAATGQPAFSADSAVSMMYRALHETPAVPEALGHPLATLVARALAKEPTARPGVEEIAEALRTGRLDLIPAGPGAAGAPAGRVLPPPVAGQPGAVLPLPVSEPAQQPLWAGQPGWPGQTVGAGQPGWAGQPAGARRPGRRRSAGVVAGVVTTLAIAAVAAAAFLSGASTPATTASGPDSTPGPTASPPDSTPGPTASPPDSTPGPTASEPDFSRHLYAVSWDDGVTVHTGPRRATASVTWLPEGTVVHIVCRTQGDAAPTGTGKTTTWWDRIDSPVSGFITDARVDTGGYPPSVPLC